MQSVKLSDKRTENLRQKVLLWVLCILLPFLNSGRKGRFIMVFLKGTICLLCALALFSLFSMKVPGGDKAMNGLAGAAVTTFLVEAICGCIGGDLAGIEIMKEIGEAAGSMGGVAAAALVSISMGAPAVLGLAAGAVAGGFGILPGFIAGYATYWMYRVIKRFLPNGVDVIVGAIAVAVMSRAILVYTSPGVDYVLGIIGDSVMAATESTPLLMGLVLGGIMKMVCTSPLSSMALTAMLGLTGLPMGIASMACVGGAFSNGIVFKKLGVGNTGEIIAVMIEPLTQAHLVTKNAVPLYLCNFFAGGLSGMITVTLGIVNNAPGTASPIPGLLAPFAFNDPITVLIAIVGAALSGVICGFIGTSLLSGTRVGKLIIEKTTAA